MIKPCYINILISLLMVFSMQTQANTPSNKILAHLKITIDDQPVIIALFDNPASQQLLNQLPLSLELSDFAGVEKIAYLSKKLETQEVPQAKMIASDFTYYAPWGNLAIFYKGYGQANGVYALGIIESGKEQLASLNQTITITLERIN